MSILKKLLGRREEPKARVRVCVECGMPVDAHKDWCAILRTKLEMERKRPGSSMGMQTPGLAD